MPGLLFACRISFDAPFLLTCAISIMHVCRSVSTYSLQNTSGGGRLSGNAALLEDPAASLESVMGPGGGGGGGGGGLALGGRSSVWNTGSSSALAAERSGSRRAPRESTIEKNITIQERTRYVCGHAYCH